MLLFETNAMRVTIEDGIMFVNYHAEHITLEMINEGIKRRLELIGEKKYPMFVELKQMKSLTREARQRLSQKDSGKGVSHAALLSTSKVQEVLFNFMQHVYKAPMPVAMFTDKEKAIKWLKQNTPKS